MRGRDWVWLVIVLSLSWATYISSKERKLAQTEWYDRGARVGIGEAISLIGNYRRQGTTTTVEKIEDFCSVKYYHQAPLDHSQDHTVSHVGQTEQLSEEKYKPRNKWVVWIIIAGFGWAWWKVLGDTTPLV